MKKFVQPSEVDGTVKAPVSKSMMIRAIAAASLAEGVSVLRSSSDCDDVIAAMKISKVIGAEVENRLREIRIRGTGSEIFLKDKVVNCRESGLCMRLFTPVVSLVDEEIVVTGEGSLLKRPVRMMREGLSQLGVCFEDTEGRLPIKLKGPLKAGVVNIDGSVSSQFLTGLLFALPLVNGESEIRVSNLRSRPYVDMTLSVLSVFGVEVEKEGYSVFRTRGAQKYNATEYEVEGDWSGAAFLLVAGAVAGRVRVTGLRSDSLQADREVLSVLEAAGAKVECNVDYVDVSRGDLKGFNFDATQCPDLFPPLVALASFCRGESRIKGVHRLIYKESNRAKALIEEFGKIGVSLCIDEDSIVVKGNGQVKGGSTWSHGDHRIAMACAVAGMVSKKGVLIEGAEAVKKSYPTFFCDIEKLGVRVE